MKKKIILNVVFFIVICLFFSTSNAQKITQLENNFKEDYIPTGRSNIEIGIFVPIGNLSKNLKLYPNISYYLGVQINEKYAVDMGTSIFIPIKPNSLTYKLKDSILKGKPYVSGTIGFWISRTEKLNKNYTWENRLGTGIGFLQTDIPTNKPKEDNDRVRGTETIFLNIGMCIKKKISNRKDVGVAVNYYLNPYNLFAKHLIKNFGNQYATIGLSYGIN